MQGAREKLSLGYPGECMVFRAFNFVQYCSCLCWEAQRSYVGCLGVPVGSSLFSDRSNFVHSCLLAVFLGTKCYIFVPMGHITWIAWYMKLSFGWHLLLKSTKVITFRVFDLRPVNLTRFFSGAFRNFVVKHSTSARLLWLDTFENSITWSLL